MTSQYKNKSGSEIKPKIDLEPKVKLLGAKAEIRKSYKALIKVLHPDMNGGDRGHEEQLSEVVWAWDQIKDSRNFQT